jgi:hypothetical protein
LYFFRKGDVRDFEAVAQLESVPVAPFWRK